MTIRNAFLVVAFALSIGTAALAQGDLSTDHVAPRDGEGMPGIKAVRALTQLPDSEGSGPFPATYEAVPGDHDFVVYHPTDIKAAGKARKLGIYIWGNGGCMPDATIARFHLTEIASNGFIAVAPGKILSGPQAPVGARAPFGMPADATPPGGNEPGPQARPGGPGAPAPGQMPLPEGSITLEDMIAALDWILAENDRQGSPYYHQMDPERVAIGGNSCGGLLAIGTALDPRAKVVAVQNSGTFPPGGALRFVTKEDLQRLHTPILYVLGGPEDIAYANGMDDFQKITKVPVTVADRPGTGHIGVFMQPGGEGTRIELDWIKWHLNGDMKAASTFRGPDCGLCKEDGWELFRKGIE